MHKQQRIDNFQGTVDDYIAYLETKVKKLSGCRSPPFSPSDVRDDEIHNSDSVASTPQLKFIPHDSNAPPAKRQRKSKPRWQIEMDNMLCNIPSATDWPSKRSIVGLSSLTGVTNAFDMIIGGITPSTKPITTDPDCSLVQFQSLQLLNSYATTIAALEIEKTFTTQIFHFCKLVFVSLCEVLVYYGVKIKLVDDVMKICISQSDPGNLVVLRRGARWVNRMISALVTKGLGHLASETFVLCK